jgi:membrane-bound serine protease (ClpP class)
MPLMKKSKTSYLTTILSLFIFVSSLAAKVELLEDSIIAEPDTISTESAEREEKTSEGKKKVYVFEIHQEIGPGATRITERAFAAAESAGADYVIIDLDTYGGLVSDADLIRTTILNSEMTTMVFIRNNAASAGALISIACDSIYMKKGSTIGAAAVVNQTGEVMPEKYQSYMRNKMRATAEATNRDPDIAEGMVDQKMVIEGITDSTEIITFSVDEAMKHGFANGRAESIDEVLEKAGITDYELITHTISPVEKIIQLLINPAVSGILLLVIIGGLYFELQTPGVGFPILASAIAAVLYFAPLYLEGLAANWEIALFLAGLILLAVEIFVIPGFGIAGVAGIGAMVVSLSLALVRNLDGFDFSFVPSHELTRSFLMVSSILIGGILLVLFSSNAITQRNMLGRLTLREELTKESGNIIGTAIADQSLVEKTGTAATDLRPSGKVEIDGERHDAQSDGEYITRNTEVRVVKVHGAYIVVEKA